MKKILVAAVLLINTAIFAQNETSEQSPEGMVKEFFEAFHRQDTLALRNFAHDETRLQSVSIDENGNTKVTTDPYSKFLKSIASIPAEVSFEERIHEYRVEQNGRLATVTSPYTLYFNGNLYHCGVNSFELVKFDDKWKIVYLIDTRVKNDCN